MSKYNNLMLKNNHVIIYLCLYLEWLILWACGATKVSLSILSISLLLFTIWHLVLSYRYNCLVLTVFFIFVISYSYEPVKYSIIGQQIGYHNFAENDTTVYQVALYMYLFLIAICSSFRYSVLPINRKDVIQGNRSNLLIWMSCICIGLFCIIFGRVGESIFQTGGYGMTRKTQDFSTMFGYGMIPLTVALIYSKTKLRINIVLICISFYVIKDLLLGGRIDGIMLCIATYILYFRYKWTRKTTIILILIAYVFNFIWGAFRTDTTSDFYQTALLEIEKLGLASGNSGEVYYASMRIMYMIDHEVLTIALRVKSALLFIASTIVPYKYLPDLANLSSYMINRYWTGGGGLCSTFIFAFSGCFGVFLCGIIIGRIIWRFLTGSCNQYMYYYGVLLMSTVPRWYAYYPIGLIKYCIYGVIFLYLINLVYRSTRDYTSKLPPI